MIGYVVTSLAGAVTAVICSLVLLDGGWLLAIVAYLAGGLAGFSAYLALILMTPPPGPRRAHAAHRLEHEV